MPSIPRDSVTDAALDLLREGYEFIPRRCRRYGSDLFLTRLMLRNVVCMSGPEAAEAFYKEGRFTRKGATPRSTLRLLQDRGSVLLLEGDAHRRRKEMFMSLVTPEHLVALCDAFAFHWQARMLSWSRRDRDTVLLPEVQALLCEAACDWAGIPLQGGEVGKRTHALAAMLANAGTVGPRNWGATWLRMRTERWLRDIVVRTRDRAPAVREGSPLHTMTFHRDETGRLLKPGIVAAELLNLLRPIVAVANYVVFGALALHDHPEWRERLAVGGDVARERFVQEVRRFYPLFPFVGGRVREPFDWGGHSFAPGDWVLLDLYGTNRDPRAWTAPERFRPDRFREGVGDPFGFIPQGGGDPRRGHRCPGDPVAVELTKTALALLTTTMDYEVPVQDLGFDLATIPAVPRSGFMIRNVRVMTQARRKTA